MPSGTPVLIDAIGLGGPLTSGELTVPAGGVPVGSQINLAVAVTEAATGLGVTDTAGNTYTEDLVDLAHAAANIESHFFRVTDALALVEGDTITISWTNNAGVAALGWHTSGLDTATPIDQKVIAEGSSLTPSSGNITTTNADDIELGVVLVNDASPPTFTEDGNFTSIGNTLGGAGNFHIYAAYRIVSALETIDYSPTFETESQNWHCLIASYKAAAGAASLAVGDAAQTQHLDNITLTQIHALTVADLVQEQHLDTVSLNQNHDLPLQSLAQAQVLDNVTLDQLHRLSLADLTQESLLDGTELDQVHALAVADLAQVLVLDSVELNQLHTLTVADLAQALVLDNGVLDQEHYLVVADLSQTQHLDSTALDQIHVLVPDGLVQILVLDASGVTIPAIMRPQAVIIVQAESSRMMVGREANSAVVQGEDNVVRMTVR